jgi:hypothetical protein
LRIDALTRLRAFFCLLHLDLARLLLALRLRQSHSQHPVFKLCLDLPGIPQRTAAASCVGMCRKRVRRNSSSPSSSPSPSPSPPSARPSSRRRWSDVAVDRHIDILLGKAGKLGRNARLLVGLADVDLRHDRLSPIDRRGPACCGRRHRIASSSHDAALGTDVPRHRSPLSEPKTERLRAMSVSPRVEFVTSDDGLTAFHEAVRMRVSASTTASVMARARESKPKSPSCLRLLMKKFGVAFTPLRTPLKNCCRTGRLF